MFWRESQRGQTERRDTEYIGRRIMRMEMPGGGPEEDQRGYERGYEVS